MEPNRENKYHPHDYSFSHFDFSSSARSFILANSITMPDTGSSHFYAIHPDQIAIGHGVFSNPASKVLFPTVTVDQHAGTLLLNCTCNTPKKKLCDHQAQVLCNIVDRGELRIFFDSKFRQQKIKEKAAEYGLENEADAEAYFDLTYNNQHVLITPNIKGLLPVTEVNNNYFIEQLLPAAAAVATNTSATKVILVFSRHKYYKQLQVQLYEVQATRDGKIKKPFSIVDPMELLWKTSKVEEVKFYTAVSTFQQNYSKEISAAGAKALIAIVNNPLSFDAFYHDSVIAENIRANSLIPVGLRNLQPDITLGVKVENNFYDISGKLSIEDKWYNLAVLAIKFDYFILSGGNFYLPGDMDTLRMIHFFNKNNNAIVIHQSKFEAFRKNVLDVLENKVRINYSWHVPANKQQLADNGFNKPLEKLIYLSDSGNQVTIAPVMRYGDIEVSILSKKQLYARDSRGSVFIIERDEAAELDFTALLLKQHPDFYEQLHMQAFYLTKTQFFNDGWFLNAMDIWRQENITVYGFKEIRNNRFNEYKPAISIEVKSGTDWFDTNLDVHYGKQKASLRQLHKSIENKSNYVQLDDGSLGILPAEWIAKFAAWFSSGEIKEDVIRTPKMNFAAVGELYERDMLSPEVKTQLELYESKLNDFESITPVEVPASLQTDLRSYQQQGLNWLNFLDDFGFGGCLADDMGLGKTIQVIAFMLLLRNKRPGCTHLVVVPTSLVFNWQEELEKFAPELKLLTLQGNNRVKRNDTFSQFDIVLTSYGVLLSDLHFLKTFYFSYIFLDESQSIKNPDSQRYQAVCSLQSYNKIVLTGTPIENNSLDIYGQLSFACPGLLGSKKYFKDIYATPIDQFGDSKRAAALQQKIHAFILRRTKTQVATELPAKTEMIIYCEMGIEQRKVYDAYEREFRNYLLHQPEEDLPRNSMHILQGLTKLRQICDSPVLLKDAVFYGDAATKINVLVEQIESRHQQHKILVFSQFVSMLELIKTQLIQKNIAFEWLTGQTNNRADAVNAFQQDDVIRVFLISLKAGGTGLNLTEADYVYLVDPWWNPAVENQAIDRSYRIGQQKPVVAVRLICPNTIEEKIMKLQATKQDLAVNLVKTDKWILKNLSKQALLNLLSDEL